MICPHQGGFVDQLRPASGPILFHPSKGKGRAKCPPLEHEPDLDHDLDVDSDYEPDSDLDLDSDSDWHLRRVHLKARPAPSLFPMNLIMRWSRARVRYPTLTRRMLQAFTYVCEFREAHLMPSGVYKLGSPCCSNGKIGVKHACESQRDIPASYKNHTPCCNNDAVGVYHPRWPTSRNLALARCSCGFC